ncbi:MAG: gliding motility-associated C-terminal domain-containing protein [Bacteroidota bacterium]
MNKYLRWICVILYMLCVRNAYAQVEYDTTTYSVRFFTQDESMWNAGVNYSLPPIEKYYSFNWNQSKTLGGMESVVGMDFGMQFYAKTKGLVGIGFYMSGINGGNIDSIVYPIEVTFIIPKGEYINAGQTIKIISETKIDESQRPTVETTFPLEGKIGINLDVDLETDFNLRACAFDVCIKLDPKDIHECVGTVMDFKMPTSPFIELNTFNNNPRATVPAIGPIPCNLPNLTLNIPCFGQQQLIQYDDFWPTTQEIEFFPIEFGASRTIKSKHPLSYVQKAAKAYEECIADTANTHKSEADCLATRDNIKSVRDIVRGDQQLEQFVEGAFSLPYIDTLYTTILGNNLRSRGSATAVDMTFKPLNLMAGGKFHDGRIDVPVPCTDANMYAKYMLIRPQFNMNVDLKQDFNFDAKVVVTLLLPAKLDYRVKNKQGTILSSGHDSVITYQIGHDLFIDFPCNYEYMDFNPIFRVENELSNRTYVSIQNDGTLEALEIGIGMDDIVVVPEITIHIPVPFTDGYDITIPEVSFGFEASVGPLIDESISKYMSNPQDLNIDINIFNKTWEVTSFDEIPMPSFRVAPSKLSTHIDDYTIACYGDVVGELEVETQAGTPPFSYIWSNLQTSKKITNLTPGDYYVKVRDKNGCEVVNGAVVHQRPQLNIHTDTIVHPRCFNYRTGAIRTEARGGTPPYSYSWSNNKNQALIENLTAGTYILELTDNNNCSVEQEYTLTEPPPLKTYVNHKTDVLCYGEKTGSVFVNVTGGVPGYDFQWSTGDVSQNIDSIAAGMHTLTVFDRNNCQTTRTVEITQPPQLQLEITEEEQIRCYKGDNGTLLARIIGGTQPYDISWYSPQYTLRHTEPLLDSLSEGLYQVEVFDAHNCYQKDTFYLSAPQEPFTSTLKPKHVSCYGTHDGEFNISVSGGQNPYSYSWSDGSAEADRYGLSAGTYEVEITDSRQCKTVNNMVLLQPPPLAGTFTPTLVSCDGEYDGKLRFLPRGGTPPYQFSWSAGDTDALAVDLPQGYHSLMLTDSKGCVEEFEYELGVDGTACFDIPTAFSPNGDNYNDTWVIKNISAMYPHNSVEIFTKDGYVLYTSGDEGYEPWNGTHKGKDVPAGTYYYTIDLGNGTPVIQGTITILR